VPRAVDTAVSVVGLSCGASLLPTIEYIDHERAAPKLRISPEKAEDPAALCPSESMITRTPMKPVRMPATLVRLILSLRKIVPRMAIMIGSDDIIMLELVAEVSLIPKFWQTW
jgi:hypothetical protein